MSNYLSKIVERKIEEVRAAEVVVPLESLKKMPHYLRECVSLQEKFSESERAGVICEYKRASPSRGVINKEARLEQTVLAYQHAGAFAVSVLTDNVGFLGTLEDLNVARSVLSCPILRKDFIISDYQVHEAKANGADIVLLIAACLTKDEVYSLSELTHDLGMEVLLEVHGVDELDYLGANIDFLGVNNRDLKTFRVTLDISREIAQRTEVSIPKISESGIKSIDEIQELEALGYKGFLIGESFMATSDPGNACKRFLDQLAIEGNRSC